MKINLTFQAGFDEASNKLKSFAAHFPLLFAFATTLVGMLCLLWTRIIAGLSQVQQIVWGRVTICLFAICLITYLGWWRETGFVRPTSWRIVIPYLPLIFLTVVAKTFDVITYGIHTMGLKLILLGLMVYLLGGFMEEAVFRGLVLRTLLPKGLTGALVISSLLFALAHFLNLLVGASLLATIWQVTIAFLIGFAYAAPLAVTRNIWPLVILHGLGNFIGYLNVGGLLNTAATSKAPSFAEVITSLILFLLLDIYSLWLLRRTQRLSLALPSSQSAASKVKAHPS